MSQTCMADPDDPRFDTEQAGIESWPNADPAPSSTTLVPTGEEDIDGLPPGTAN